MNWLEYLLSFGLVFMVIWVIYEGIRRNRKTSVANRCPRCRSTSFKRKDITNEVMTIYTPRTEAGIIMVYLHTCNDCGHSWRVKSVHL